MASYRAALFYRIPDVRAHFAPGFVRWRLLRNVPRRWRFRCRAGSARTRPVAIVYGWLKLHALFYAGVSPKKLAAIYAAQASRKQTKQRAN
jgi:hypothetical protein